MTPRNAKDAPLCQGETARDGGRPPYPCGYRATLHARMLRGPGQTEGRLVHYCRRHAPYWVRDANGE